MAGYLTLIITASFFCTLISSFLSDKGAGKTAKMVVNIVILAVVVIPIINYLSSFSNNLTVPVINDTSSHIIDNTEDDMHAYRQWLAKVTASQLSEDIAESVKEGTGITVRVECPWRFEGEDVVFDKIRIFTSSDERYFDNIESYVKLHYSLDSECIGETE